MNEICKTYQSEGILYGSGVSILVVFYVFDV